MGQRIDKPVVVTSEDGLVTIIGPDGILVAFSPEAAAITGCHLLEHAAFAKGASDISAARRASTR